MIYSEEEFHLKINKGDVGKYVILCGDPARCEKIAALFDEPEFLISNREFTIYNGYLEGEKVSAASTGIGGPSAAITVEELAHVGADTFIRTGTSGGMQVDVMGGDLVIATSAIRMEGTTREYAPLEFPAVADFDLVQALKEAAAKLGANYHVGVVHSKDSFYGQHDPESMPAGYELKGKWDAYMKMGALASEMETAAIYIVSSARKLRAGSVVTVVGNQTRRAQGLEDPKDFDTGLAVETAVEAMRIVIKNDKNK